MVFGLTSMIPPSYYIKAFSGIFGLYGVQMALIPGNMVTDHFDTKPTPLVRSPQTLTKPQPPSPC